MSPNQSVHPPPAQSARVRTAVRVIGITAAVATACTVWLGLWVTPPDATQGNLGQYGRMLEFSFRVSF